MSISALVSWLSDFDTESATAGKFTKQLASLAQAKLPLIPGFVITTDAYDTFINQNNLNEKIKQLLAPISFERADSLMQGEQHIKQLFAHAVYSDLLLAELHEFYEELSVGKVSLTLYENDFKHNQYTVDFFTEFLDCVKKLWSEMFSGSAMYKRYQQKSDVIDIKAEIVVQKYIKADTSGTVISVESVTHDKNKLVISVTHPHEGDHYVLSKKNLTIIDRSLKHNTNLPKLSRNEILTIANMAKKAEKHLYFPQKITWIMADNILYISQVIPVSYLPQLQQQKKIKLVQARGKGLPGRIITGSIKIISNRSDVQKIASSDIAVLKKIDKTYIPYLKKSAGIILESFTPAKDIPLLLQTNGIPIISQINNARKLFRNGTIVTLNSPKGEIYLGGFL